MGSIDLSLSLSLTRFLRAASDSNLKFDSFDIKFALDLAIVVLHTHMYEYNGTFACA